MERVVEPQAPHRVGIARGQRREDFGDWGGGGGDGVRGVENGAGDDARGGAEGEVAGAGGEDGFAVVDGAGGGEEADEALGKLVGWD